MKKERRLKSDKTARDLSINAVYWEEAIELLRKNFEMRCYMREGENSYHVALEGPSEEQRLIVMERNTAVVQPALIEPHTIFHISATHSKKSAITLPLTSIDLAVEHGPTAKIEMKQPRPRIPWTVEVDGTPLLGGKNKPKRTHRLLDAIRTARSEGATSVELQISKAARAYFKARDRRHKWVYDALKKQDTNLRTWCLDNDQHYKILYNVLQRGDEIADAKEALCKIAEKSEQQMWPVIDWS